MKQVPVTGVTGVRSPADTLGTGVTGVRSPADALGTGVTGVYFIFILDLIYIHIYMYIDKYILTL